MRKAIDAETFTVRKWLFLTCCLFPKMTLIFVEISTENYTQTKNIRMEWIWKKNNRERERGGKQIMEKNEIIMEKIMIRNRLRAEN